MNYICLCCTIKKKFSFGVPLWHSQLRIWLVTAVALVAAVVLVPCWARDFLHAMDVGKKKTNFSVTESSNFYFLNSFSSQILHWDYYVNGVVFPDPSGESYMMIMTFFILAFDTFLYLMLTLYFERVLPGK